MTNLTAEQVLDANPFDFKEPVYGTIPYMGGTWNVYFRVSGSTVLRHLSGAGLFPRDRFPDLPVIDLAGDDRAFTWQKCDDWPCDLDKALAAAHELNLTIITT